MKRVLLIVLITYAVSSADKEFGNVECWEFGGAVALANYFTNNDQVTVFQTSPFLNVYCGSMIYLGYDLSCKPTANGVFTEVLS